MQSTAPGLKASSDIQGVWSENLLAAMGRPPYAEPGTPEVSNKELARRTSVHPTTISRILDGTIDPTIELKVKIAAALDRRMDQLWEWPKIVPSMPERVAS